MLNESFCDHLEFYITQKLKELKKEETRGFWCDGVLLSEPATYYTQKFVNDNRQITMKACIGKEGQEDYKLVINFGSKALSRFARGLEIESCFSNTVPVQVNTTFRTLVMFLD